MNASKFMDLTKPEYSYMIGFLQCDGHMSQSSRNRGRLSVELNAVDIELLIKFKDITPFNSTIRRRQRTTNFSKNSNTAIWNLFSYEARQLLLAANMPYGSKSQIVKPPEHFIERDYFRGLIDADGSVGITGQGLPFIFFTTQSESLIRAFCLFVEKLTGYKYTSKRNKRDNIYNISLFREKAQIIISMLYYNSSLCLHRKYEKSLLAMKWRRPISMRKVFFKKWSDDENNIVMNNTIEIAAYILHRSVSSIRNRKFKLKKINTP